MKTVWVQMLESVSGEGDEHNKIDGSFSLPVGAEVELPAELAEKWTASGRCKILNVAVEPPVEAPPVPAKGSKK